MITLRFVTTHDLVSSTIRGAEMGFWASHVEWLSPDDELVGAHIQGGVAARARDYDAGQWSKELFVDLPCSEDQAGVFERWMYSQIGKRYDLKALGEMAIGTVTGEAPNWGVSDSWICSALIVGGLLTAGIVKAAPATVRLATPRDVLCACAALTTIGDPRTPGA